MREAAHLTVPADIPRRGRKKLIHSVYLITLLVTFNFTITLYINSGFLSQFMAERFIGLVYAAGALIALLSLANISKLLRRFGSYRLTLFLMVMGVVSSLALAFTATAWIAVIFFIVLALAIRLVKFDIDLFVKNLSETRRTGTVRGILYAVVNTSSVIGPLAAGYLVVGTDFDKVYLVSAAIFVLAIIPLVRQFKYYRDARYLGVKLRTALKHLRASMNLRKGVSIRFALSFLSAWINAYIPLYLFSHIGFSWREVNILFAIKLFFYLIIETPLGKLADVYSAEKKIMLAGGVLAILPIAVMPLVTSPQFATWLLVLIPLGIGFCAIEIGIETYFFRRIHKNNSEFVSIFRMTNPAAYLVSTTLASAFLFVFPLRYIFWLLIPILVWQVWTTFTLTAEKRAA